MIPWYWIIIAFIVGMLVGVAILFIVALKQDNKQFSTTIDSQREEY